MLGQNRRRGQERTRSGYETGRRRRRSGRRRRDFNSDTGAGGSCLDRRGLPAELPRRSLEPRRISIGGHPNPPSTEAAGPTRTGWPFPRTREEAFIFRTTESLMLSTLGFIAAQISNQSELFIHPSAQTLKRPLEGAALLSGQRCNPCPKGKDASVLAVIAWTAEIT